MVSARLQRQSDDGEHRPPDSIAPDAGGLPEPGLLAVPGLNAPPSALRRHAADDPLGGSAVSGDVADVLRRRRGQGASLPEDVAGPLGEHFGMDLSPVRVHADQEAGRIAQSLQATAFTHGTDIYFAPGAYRPSSPDGQRVLAHEVSHIDAQRSGADRGGPGALTVGRADDPAEAAADRSADRAMQALRRSAAPNRPRVPHAPAHGAGIPDPAGPEIRRLKWPWQKAKGKGSTTAPAPQVTAPVTITPTEQTKPGDADTAEPTDKAKAPEEDYPRIATIGTEQVQVDSKAEEDEADRIATELKDVYGLDLSSPTTVKAIKKQYTNVPKKVTDKLTTSVWTIQELRALSEAASYYAPILGSQRDESTLASSVQGVTTIGKLKNAIDSNRDTGKLDDTTLGEYFAGSKNLGLFDSGTNYKDKNFVRKGEKKTDVQTSLTGTAIHEMAHALVQPSELANWVSEMDYWKDRYTKSGKWRTEKPPTSYGKTNAAEDLCESVALYFINADKLKKKCPKRHAFVDKVVKGWTPKTKAAVVDSTSSAPGTESPSPSPDENGS